MSESIILGISGVKQSGKSTLAEFVKAWYEVDNRLKGVCTFCVNEKDGSVVWDNEPHVFEKVKVYTFADSLKDFCVDTLGLRHEQCWGTDDEKNTETPYLWDNLPKFIREKYSNSVIKTGQIGDSPMPVARSGKMTGREVMQIFGTDVAREMFEQNIWVNATLRKIRKEGYPLAIIADVRFPSEVKAITGNNGSVIRLTRTFDATDLHPSETALDDYNWEEHGDQVKFIDNDGKTVYDKNDMALSFLKGLMCGV